ncbi:MAG: hypothetical protein ACK4IZ_12480 [Flavobacterium sp.]|uniref:hypothetical protein n=1 Tax=Flavobacterium sp. TaxID=239 RepID=UPI00391A120C
MNIKMIFIFLFTFLSIATYSQVKPKQLYQIIISKSDENDIKNRDFVKIDSLGNVLSFNKETGEKVNLKSFNKSLVKFVSQESNVKKIPANNNYSPLTVMPGKGRYSFAITVTFLEDYHNEKEFKTKTKYEWISVTDVNQRELFLKYLSKEDRIVMEKFLD